MTWSNWKNSKPGVDIMPWDQSIYHMLGMAYKQEGYFRNAIRYFDRAIQNTAELKGIASY